MRTSNIEFLHSYKDVKIRTPDALYIFTLTFKIIHYYQGKGSSVENVCTLQLYVSGSNITDDVTTNGFTVYEDGGRWIGERQRQTDVP